MFGLNECACPCMGTEKSTWTVRLQYWMLIAVLPIAHVERALKCPEPVPVLSHIAPIWLPEWKHEAKGDAKRWTKKINCWMIHSIAQKLWPDRSPSAWLDLPNYFLLNNYCVFYREVKLKSEFPLKSTKILLHDSSWNRAFWTWPSQHSSDYMFSKHTISHKSEISSSSAVTALTWTYFYDNSVSAEGRGLCNSKTLLNKGLKVAVQEKIYILGFSG